MQAEEGCQTYICNYIRGTTVLLIRESPWVEFARGTGQNTKKRSQEGCSLVGEGEDGLCSPHVWWACPITTTWWLLRERATCLGSLEYWIMSLEGLVFPVIAPLLQLLVTLVSQQVSSQTPEPSTTSKAQTILAPQPCPCRACGIIQIFWIMWWQVMMVIDIAPGKPARVGWGAGVWRSWQVTSMIILKVWEEILV